MRADGDHPAVHHHVAAAHLHMQQDVAARNAGPSEHL